MGIISISSSLFGSFYSYIIKGFINPDNQDPEIEIKHGKLIDRYYSYDVIKNLPSAYIKLAIIMGVVFMLGYIGLFFSNLKD